MFKVLSIGRDVRILVNKRVINVSRRRIEEIVGSAVESIQELEERILDMVGDF